MIVLDTHAWIWSVSGSEQLSRTAEKQISQSSVIGISAISCWEIAMLVSRNRLGLNQDVMDWIETALTLPKTRLLSLDPKIMVYSTRLPGDFHGDPADRFIASTCLVHGADLVSKDKKLLKWPHLNVLW